MNITIRIIYKGYTSRIMQRGEFRVNAYPYKQNPHQEAARVAFAWLQRIRREAHVEEIIEVVYNDDNDITELVRALEKAPLE
jgi:ribosomal protein L25 (general stress protein Ctc)